MRYQNERVGDLVGEDLQRRAIDEEHGKKIELKNIWGELEHTAGSLEAIATSLYHIEDALKVKIMMDLGYSIPEDYSQKLVERKEEGIRVYYSQEAK